jgi:hypothetical protein
MLPSKFTIERPKEDLYFLKFYPTLFPNTFLTPKEIISENSFVVKSTSAE